MLITLELRSLDGVLHHDRLHLPGASMISMQLLHQLALV